MQRSECQAAASRENGAKSKGPVTPEGKTRVSANALTHGLLSKAVVLRWESRDLFDAFQQAFLDQYQPSNDAEFMLVEEIVAAKWRLRRLWSIETRLLGLETDLLQPALDEEFGNVDIATNIALAYRKNCDESRATANLGRQEARLARQARAAEEQLLRLRAGNGKFPNKPGECTLTGEAGQDVHHPR